MNRSIFLVASTLALAGGSALAAVTLDCPTRSNPGVPNDPPCQAGFPTALVELGQDSNLYSSPTIADLDGNGSPEIIFGTQGGRVVAVRANGTLMWSRSTGTVSVASKPAVADIDADGIPDVIVGADRADPDGDSSAGESYVVFSASVPLNSASVRARSRNGNPPRTAFGTSGDGSNDSTPDARAWIDFADGADATELASAEIVTLTRSDGAFPSSAANVSWRVQTTRQNWSAAELRLSYLDSELIAGESALQIYYSSDGNAPFTSLASVAHRRNNTISATISQAGYYFIGIDTADLIFANGFE